MSLATYSARRGVFFWRFFVLHPLFEKFAERNDMTCNVHEFPIISIMTHPHFSSFCRRDPFWGHASRRISETLKTLESEVSAMDPALQLQLWQAGMRSAQWLKECRS